MARITIEDCLDKVENRFQLVHMAAKRVRQIREGSEYLVSSPKNEDIVVALREVAAGKVVVKDAGDRLEWDTRPSICVVMASEGYPGAYERGRPIRGLDEAGRGQGGWVTPPSAR